MKRFIKFFKRIFVLVVAVFMLIFVTNVWIVNSTFKNVFFDIDALPGHYHVALILGTSPFLTDGSPNPFFDYRIKAAAKLYKTGKITHLIVSGDNRTKYYNEPAEMRKRLIGLGVPDSAITLDYAGLRTLDSIVRCKEIFGQHKFIVITQAFHSYRALFISRYYDITTVALAAEDPASGNIKSVYWREYLARANAVLDLYVFKTRPRYMGKREPLSY